MEIRRHPTQINLLFQNILPTSSSVVKKHNRLLQLFVYPTNNSYIRTIKSNRESHDTAYSEHRKPGYLTEPSKSAQRY